MVTDRVKPPPRRAGVGPHVARRVAKLSATLVAAAPLLVLLPGEARADTPQQTFNAVTQYVSRSQSSADHNQSGVRRIVRAAPANGVAVARNVPRTAAAESEAPGSEDAAYVWWSGPDPDGGYRCLQQTGGASGQCDAAMGLGPWAIPATDGGYRCLRDTLGASGQCNEAMGLGRPDIP